MGQMTDEVIIAIRRLRGYGWSWHIVCSCINRTYHANYAVGEIESTYRSGKGKFKREH